MQQSLEIKQKHSGYVLFDLVITLVIIGFLTVGAIQVYEHFDQRRERLVTEHNMDIVVKAFSNYVQTRWRLPCPADPVAAAGTDFGTERANCTAVPANSQGIIPFRTLGIPEHYALDGYGNFLTYVVSPVFVRQNQITDTAADVVHERLAYAITEDNIALLPKAQFCGGDPAFNIASDIVIQQNTAGMIGSNDPAKQRDDTAYYAQPYNTGDGPPDANYYRDIRSTGVAMALISHGANGVGAYLGNNTGNQFTPGAGGNSEEATRTEDRIVQVERDYNYAGGNANYDDIILFLTQDQVYAAAGGASCEAL